MDDKKTNVASLITPSLISSIFNTSAGASELSKQVIHSSDDNENKHKLEMVKIKENALNRLRNMKTID